MTLLNAIRRDDRVIIVSDSAALDDDANLAGNYNKVILMPHIRAAVACRGNAMIAMILLSGLHHDYAWHSFDSFKASFADAVRATISAAGPALSADPATALGMDFVVAGWSETRGPDSFFLRTLEGTHVPAWEVINPEGPLMMPCNDEIFGQTPYLADRSVPLSDDLLVKAANLQRAYIEPFGPHKIPSSWVGGFLQATTITEHEITTRIIHRWPDELGSRLMA